MTRSGVGTKIIVGLTVLTVACGGRGCGDTSAVGSVSTAASQNYQGPQASASSVAQRVHATQAELSAALSGSGTLAPRDVALRLQITFDAMRKALAQLPADSFDLEHVVEREGRSEDKLFAWVRDETQLVPYLGMLRGARGVLMDRQGNSLDRSLLLAKLFELAGVEARLARMTLNGTQTAALLRTLQSERRKPAAGSDPTAGAADSLVQEYSKQFRTDPGLLGDRLKALRASEDAMGYEAAKRAHLQAEKLLKTAGLNQVRSNSEGATSLEALADHWWVQVKKGDEWVNRDLSAIVGTGSPDDVTTYDAGAIPEDLHHTLRLEVLIECLCEGQIVERPVLEHTLTLAEHAFEPIVLYQAPTKEIKTNESLTSEKAWPQLRGALAKQTEWMPVLSIGESVVTQMAFTTAGLVGPAGSEGSAGRGGLADAFGGGADAPGRMTAEIVRYELGGPGVTEQSERRVLVDWLGTKARSAAATTAPAETSIRQSPVDLLHSIEILPLAAQLSPEFVARETANALMRKSANAINLLQTQPKAPALDGSDDSPVLSLRLLELALARHQWNPERDSIFLRHANVLTRHQGVRDTAAGAEAWSAFDIVFNRIAVRPHVTQAVAVAVRARQGALDTNAEIILDARHGAVTNVSEIMATMPDREWTVRRESSDTVVHIEPKPAGGEEPPGYWLVDITDGTILGYTAAGWGGVSTSTDQAMTDFAIKHEKILRVMGAVFRYLMAMVCAASAIRQMLTADSKTSSWYVMGRGSIKMTGCAIGGIYATMGISVGGAVGNLYSRIGDIFSVAFTISSWFS